MKERVKVLVVDDSRTARELIRRSFLKYPEIDVIGMASNPIEARDLIIADQPDVITLDIEMPGMNGLQFLEKIMRLRPIPVVMVSSMTTRGANTAITALQMGAFECFPKQGGAGEAFAGLGQIVLEAARYQPGHRQATPGPRPVRTEPVAGSGTAAWRTPFDVVGIGSSTGGVEAVEEVIKDFPAKSPPIVICQHMPSLYTSSFAARLDSLIPQLSVAEAQDGEMLAPGMVRIAPGGEAHLVLEGHAPRLFTRLRSGEPVGGHRPSVDRLFHSIAQTAGRTSLGIILTGMGQDGAEGLLAMRRAGARTIGQDRASSVVYGMPRVAAELGAVEKVGSLMDIPGLAMGLH
ncbi:MULTISPECIES: chemotaxis response regulator protein-glutamate methylesterase [Bombella]|uniref:protein-glutamate methylesterase/protein-glutamine glutaminase n=1 Tax=Bombella TaxID=1654741 RepID=UPI00139B7573|nr:chemotaxis response regulator protein-glutamate methylesterase [Bombella apis]MCL1562405.1 chemotaxis response regulator protein-glutamate methylesterase [Parasaccharibacter sp. TMW 2.1886]MUG79898.1 chemotaxis-specific protein-glutamate methyltransferase CheB [Bombella sp. ESL0380]MCT6814213.1 chemotaxis response regulator protein-glutamate methylesterase [Bombella apis]MCT6819452.1 chemotaxis response regulator protein-glutamate methylesterase [Bombella apis]MCT6845729.1 chemotaxis respon